MFGIFKKKTQTATPVQQHIAIPVKELEKLNSEEKRRNMDRLSAHGWKMTIRALGLIVMSRESSAQIPMDLQAVYGVDGIRSFKESELRFLKRRMDNYRSDKRQQGILSQVRENKLIAPFESFARESGFTSEEQKQVLGMLRFRAARGQIVGYEDIEKYPFSMLGDIKALFGNRLNDVISFQEKATRMEID